MSLNTTIGKRGYTVLKEDLSSSEISKIRKDLTVQAFVNQNLEKEAIKQIEDFLKIKLHNIDLGELDTLGSIGVIHNDTGVIGEFIGQNKLNNLNKISDIKFSLGTINQGSDYIKSGIFKNSKGFVIGEMTSGVEIINIEQELFR